MKKHLTYAKGQVQLTGLLIAATIVGLIVLVLIPLLDKVSEYPRQTTCTSNQKQIATAVAMYVQEHDMTMPSTANFWNDIGVSGKILKCPTANKRIQNSYGQNCSVNGLKIEKIYDPAGTFLTADVRPTSGNIISIGNGDPRHNKRLIASYVDGHVCLIEAPASFVYAPNDLAKGLPKDKDIYTPNGKYNASHWSLGKLDGDQKVAADDKRSKLTVSSNWYNIITLAAIGEKASAVAKVDLSTFYPKDIKRASDYWAFSSDISFEKNINKSGMLATRTAIIFLDEKKRVIAALYILRKAEEGILYERLLLNYDNNKNFPIAKSKIKTSTIVMRYKSMNVADEWKNSDNSEFRRSTEDFEPFSIAVRNNILYVSYGEWNGKTQINLNKANWKRPTTMKIICFENEFDGVTNAIELKNLRFVLK